jgi:uncharacterized protein
MRIQGPRVTSANPFKYGPIALDDFFTDRDAEVAELSADALNGQDVVIFAPRRYGKTSLVHRTAQQLVRRRALVAEVNLWFTPTKEKLAGRLARELAEILGIGAKVKEAARVFARLRVVPTMTVNPEDGDISFSFAAGQAPQDIDDTLERLLRMLGETAASRRRPVVLILDEFQEIVDLDPDLTKLLRSVFQEQPEVAHIYLGSKRHLMERIFSDHNEPFWRSAKRVELGPIGTEAFAPFIRSGFRDHRREIDEAVVDEILRITGGHPYATQELCYFLWAETGAGKRGTPARLEEALTKLLRSEHSHFSDLWDRASANQRVLLTALAAEPGRPLSQEYRMRYGLRAPSTVQRSIAGLAQQEIVSRDRGFVRISEPFFAEWIQRNA